MYVFSLLLEKRILLDFLGFYASTFSVLWTLLPKVFGVVLFCVCE